MGPGKKDVINHIIESNWNNYSEEEKIRIIHDAADLEPEQSIIAVLAGITSYQFSVRNEARKGLELIRLKISNFFSEYEDKEQYLKGMKVSASVCFRIYSLIRPDMTPKENNYYFTLLLDFEGKGPYFAYLAVYNETIPLGAMEQMMNTFSDYRRLALVDQYLQATPSARLKFGFSFIRLLKSIKQRDAVINFYAALFDRQGDADPFLNNISNELKDPAKIVSNELQSQSPEIKIKGLKALAVISTKISSKLLIDILLTENVGKVRFAIYEIIENSSIGTYADMFYPILEIFYA